jgi:predicted O-linked N-acetylglucosamine transferase (SPINDLY family)
VQVSWLGYEGSTQLREMDVLIGDWLVTPRSNSPCHSENVVRLPFDFACYRAPDYAPEVTATPALVNGHITFGSFNKLAKLGPTTLRLWARILCRMPKSRLLLKWRHAPSTLASQRIIDILAKHGVSHQRVEFRDVSPHPEMLKEYGDIDIALDPFPFSGGATTCDALWMGVPVVSMLGRRFASNHTASHLRAAGMPELVAENEDHYLDICVRLGTDPVALNRLRQTLRPQMVQSPLCNERLFMMTVERHYRELLNSVNWAL